MTSFVAGPRGCCLELWRFSPVLGKLEATVGLKWGMVLCAAFMVMTSVVLCVGLRKKIFKMNHNRGKNQK